MKDQSPILIAGPPRSGTTMLAGLLYYHNGVWIGRSRKTKYPGTNSDFGSENLDIKDIMKRLAAQLIYQNWHTPLPDTPLIWHIRDRLKDDIESFVPENTRWLVKTSWLLAFHKAWDAIYPEAVWIFPKRSEESILDSMNRHPSMRKRPDNMKRKFIQALHARQSETKSIVHNCIDIDVYKLSQQNRQEVQRLFDFLGSEVNWKVVNEWLDPKAMKK